MSEKRNGDGTFFAALSRMKYIERWALMRNSRPENLCEHSMEVAMIAHALCMIGNVRFGKDLNADRAAVLGLFHDAPEIITGDMPTPVKYYSDEIRSAYKHVEEVAQRRLLAGLPEDLRELYSGLLRPEKTVRPSEEERYLQLLVKAADKISALIKCMEEESAGNTEFSSARAATEEKLSELREQLPEAGVFLDEFLPSYGKTLDELL